MEETCVHYGHVLSVLMTSHILGARAFPVGPLAPPESPCRGLEAGIFFTHGIFASSVV